MLKYRYLPPKLEKISRKLLQLYKINIIMPNVNFLQFKNSGGIEVKEKTTILIADDNADFAMTLVNYLEKEEEMEVIGVAKNGKEACDMVMNTRTRCTIT